MTCTPFSGHWMPLHPTAPHIMAGKTLEKLHVMEEVLQEIELLYMLVTWKFSQQHMSVVSSQNAIIQHFTLTEIETHCSSGLYGILTRS
jgi:hypothetical protein